MKINVDGKVVETDILNGYRRVSSGYTRKGDLSYVPKKDRGPVPYEWEDVAEMQLVPKLYCVIRPIDPLKNDRETVTE